ncbi:hypothetical protein Aduo_003744 [Ancylostoma duodenale]
MYADLHLRDRKSETRGTTRVMEFREIDRRSLRVLGKRGFDGWNKVDHDLWTYSNRQDRASYDGNCHSDNMEGLYKYLSSDLL